jgi:3-hydroxybutyryl-CoA dehydrogenase
MRLVEIISGVATKESVLNELQNFSTSIEKVCVLAKDSPGFIVNRIARPFYSEALKILEEETASVSDIDLLLRSAGFKMGPFELMDLIGLDVNFAVTTSVYEGLNKPSRFTPSGIQRKKIEEGALGRKSGKGFYEYQKK